MRWQSRQAFRPSMPRKSEIGSRRQPISDWWMPGCCTSPRACGSPRWTQLLDAVREAAWGPPDHLIADRFRLAGADGPVLGASRWSPASLVGPRHPKIFAPCRKLFLDGPVVPTVACRPLLIASLSVAAVKNDDAGSMRLVKQDTSQ